uniref:Uncharacterized protein n=1 Tax=Aegilops tauschii TaxID=37682 RepID=M8BXV7_AEGTA
MAPHHPACIYEGPENNGEALLQIQLNRYSSRVGTVAEFVAALKDRVGACCSMFQCLLAHVWKKITAARGLKRRSSPRLQVRDVLNSSYDSVVGTIRDAVARINSEYVQSFVDFGGLADANGGQLAVVQLPSTRLRHRRACCSAAPGLARRGLMFFVPSHKAKGGVQGLMFFMAVTEEHLTAFQRICYSLD